MRLDLEEVVDSLRCDSHWLTVARTLLKWLHSAMDTTTPHAEVTVYSPVSEPFKRPLVGSMFAIGRSSECAIPVKDRYLSRRHAEIEAVNGNWVLKDLGSANGTYLNGARVEHDMSLVSGDRIRVGDTELVFVTSEHSTDRFLAIADTAAQPNIVIPIQDLDRLAPDTIDAARLQTLNALARELIEDRPMHELFGFMADKVIEHLQPSRAAIALLSSDGKSFTHVEVRRQDENDATELTLSSTLLTTLVEEKKALAFVDVSVDEKLSRANSIIMQGIRSIICAPLMIGGKVVGLIYVDYLVTQKAISADDVRLLAQIARFAATKLETTELREEALKKRLMDEELRTAANIQRLLLPEAPTAIEGYTFAGTNQPCRTVSGDYYDFLVRPDGRIYFVIADVSGKGVTAGLMMAGLQIAFRIFAKTDADPATLATQLNDALHENLPRSKFVTLILGRLDTSSGDIEYVNAGHTPPVWVRRESVEEVVAGDILLGVVTNATYVNRKIHLGSGDALVLYTDGASEVHNAGGVELGATGITSALANAYGSEASSISLIVTDAVLTHAGEADALDDDVTVVVISRDMHGVA